MFVHITLLLTFTFISFLSKFTSSFIALCLTLDGAILKQLLQLGAVGSGVDMTSICHQKLSLSLFLLYAHCITFHTFRLFLLMSKFTSFHTGHLHFRNLKYLNPIGGYIMDMDMAIYSKFNFHFFITYPHTSTSIFVPQKCQLEQMTRLGARRNGLWRSE